MSLNFVSIKRFAQTISDEIITDRWVFIACSGEMGSGKSCLTSQLAEETANINKTPFSYQNNITFLRSELTKWVDGEGEEAKGQKPEKSSILADELISMFFKRNWYDSDQIDGIELLNKCRDRHLAVFGNVPEFWDLDSAIYPALTYWIFIEQRGIAHVMTKDNNPYVKDKWHVVDNKKIFAKTRDISQCHGYVATIKFDDWTPEKKIEYYDVRNTKRKNSEGQRAKKEKYSRIKKQRDLAIREWKRLEPSIKQREIAEILDLSQEAVGKIISDV